MGYVPPPAPMAPPPPQPPAKKSGVLKWVLIGCGGIVLVAGLLCGGCILWGVNFAKKSAETMERVDRMIRNNAVIAAELGSIQSVVPVNRGQPAQSASNIPIEFQVTGDKAQGTVRGSMSMGFGGIKMGPLTLELEDGRTIPLEAPADN